jgi:hypothetical protein
LLFAATAGERRSPERSPEAEGDLLVALDARGVPKIEDAFCSQDEVGLARGLGWDLLRPESTGRWAESPNTFDVC